MSTPCIIISDWNQQKQTQPDCVVRNKPFVRSLFVCMHESWLDHVFNWNLRNFTWASSPGIYIARVLVLFYSKFSAYVLYRISLSSVVHVEACHILSQNVIYSCITEKNVLNICWRPECSDGHCVAKRRMLPKRRKSRIGEINGS